LSGKDLTAEYWTSVGGTPERRAEIKNPTPPERRHGNQSLRFEVLRGAAESGGAGKARYHTHEEVRTASVVISVVSLLVSITTAWLTLFRAAL
jgi:hypothetical protein